MSTKRDPRCDPKPGDIVRPKREFRAFTVTQRHEDDSISGFFSGGKSGSLCGLYYWRETWAKNAEVIHAAD